MLGNIFFFGLLIILGIGFFNICNFLFLDINLLLG